MFENMKYEKRGVEIMKDDEELEMLLGEIPHATSSLNLNPTLDDGDRYHGILSDGFFNQKYASPSSPISGFSVLSDGSSFSSLFSGGMLSLSDIESASPPLYQENKSHLISRNGFSLDLKDKQGNLMDDFHLPGNFSKMYISNEQEGAMYHPRSKNGAVQMNFQKLGASVGCGATLVPDYYRSVPRGKTNFGLEIGSGMVHPNGGISGISRERHDLYSWPDFHGSPQFSRTDKLANSMEFSVSNGSSSMNQPLADDALCAQRKLLNFIEARDAFYAANGVSFRKPITHSDKENLHAYDTSFDNVWNRATLPVRVPQTSLGAFTRDDSLMILGKGMGYGMNHGDAYFRRHKTRSPHHENGARKTHERNGKINFSHVQECCRNSRTTLPFPLAAKSSTLIEIQGHMYNMAKDQHGCRLLQRMLDEGTSHDVQIIFSAIINHAIELMMNPFGNYLMQKILEVCSEEQRMAILTRVTAMPGELVRISLNTHGTRVVQKLIETLTLRQQISLIVSALEPGFLTLIKDLNGNHVVQRCLQCFTIEDSGFIFLAAAKYCVDIATHQHGCCVLQRCISHSSGELRDNLIAEICSNGLLLAQDAFGNYAVQFILELKLPSAVSKLASQFEGKYVHLSLQKFSSHVVEKCLAVFNDETRTRIIQELLSAPSFELLLQDPHANYVIQTALSVSKGNLLSLLVNEIDSYRPALRNSPYSKRIFSNKLLKR